MTRKEFDKQAGGPVVDAVFIGWQENLPGKPPIALFDVVKVGHRLCGSTVSAKTLTENGLYFLFPEVL